MSHASNSASVSFTSMPLAAIAVRNTSRLSTVYALAGSIVLAALPFHAGAQTPPIAAGAYLDLEQISPNDTFSGQQSQGGLFLQGGLLCAAPGNSSCATRNAYQGVIGTANEILVDPTTGNQLGSTSYSLPFIFANSPGSNQIGFTAPFSATAMSQGFAETWQYTLTDKTNQSSTTGFLPTIAPGNSALTGINAQPTPFVHNVTVSTSQQGNLLTPTFNWNQATSQNPNAIRVEIWQLGSNGTASSDVYNTTLAGNATNFTVPTNSILKAGTRYSIDIENLVLRNPSNLADTANDNVLTRSRSLFDFELLSPSSIPANVNATTVATAMVNPTGSPTGGVLYAFNQQVTAGQSLLIDPLVATGYLYQKGSTDPNFASVTLPSVPGSAYRLFLQASPGGAYVDSGQTLTAGQKYNFGANGVSSFEIQGIDPNAGLDPSNSSAFVTALTFTASGQFTGTMTPLTSPVPLPAAAWLMLSGLGGFGAFARRRDAAASRVQRLQSPRKERG